MSYAMAGVLRSAVVQHGYWAVAGALLLENAGVPVPGETVLLLASFLAYSERELQLSWIILVATVACTFAGTLGYAIGLRGGRPLLMRYQTTFRIQEKTIVRGEELFARYGAATIFFARFVFGMRVIAGPIAGVLRMPWRKFVVFNFLGAAAWVTVISGAGYLVGQHWHRFERGLKRFDIGVAIVLVAAALFWWWRRWRED